MKHSFIYEFKNCEHCVRTFTVVTNGAGLNMFVLAEMKHVIRTPPHIFHLKLNDAISEELNKKLANKVQNNRPRTVCTKLTGF
jgi:hypothetical protein